MKKKFVGFLAAVLCFTAIPSAASLNASETMADLNPSCRHPSARTSVYDMKMTTYDHPVLVKVNGKDEVITCHTVSYHTTKANRCESCGKIFYIFPVETLTQHSISHS